MNLTQKYKKDALETWKTVHPQTIKNLGLKKKTYIKDYIHERKLMAYEHKLKKVGEF